MRSVTAAIGLMVALGIAASVRTFGGRHRPADGRDRAGLDLSAARSTASASTALDRLPKIMLWAWERPEDLSFIDPSKIGVAFLAKTIYLRGERVESRPRLQPLSVPDSTALMAVVRIESNQ